MNHLDRSPIKGVSGRETTALTMASIRDIVEEAQQQAEAPTQQTPLPKSQLQQPPHLRGTVPVVDKAPKPKAPAPAPEAVAELAPQAPVQPKAAPVKTPARQKRGFFGRLMGG